MFFFPLNCFPWNFHKSQNLKKKQNSKKKVRILTQVLDF